MPRFSTLAFAAALAGGALIAGSVSAQNFAQFGGPSNSTTNYFQWVQGPGHLGGNLTTYGLPHGAAPTLFTFDTGPLAPLGALKAVLTFTASSVDAAFKATAGGVTSVTQPQESGSFTFVYNGTATLHSGGYTLTPGETLLHGTFTLAALSGLLNTTSPGFGASTDSGSTVVFTSPFMTFANTNLNDLSISLSGLTTPFNANAGQSVKNFKGFATGPFSSVLVPEPAAWAMTILGVGAVGGMARRRVAAQTA
ncbi:MAG: PEPxxWA-CTERM sorting domain-containing protein [Caulobacteraceae bacterium]|nr:PEPxxWA-CTERM sorting domain-containing protein [Caulobacteraceae bacterium]